MGVVAVLLAGGRGSRMAADGEGADKPLRLLAGRPLLDHAIARIAPQVAALAISANGDPARFAAWKLPVVADGVPGQPGPLAGILAGMRWAAARGAEDVVSVAADTPFLPPDLVARLVAARHAAGAAIACASSGGRLHPAIALWPAALADALERDLRAGTRKVEGWAARFGLASVAFDVAPVDPFFNVNRPEDVIAAERLFPG